ncbi:hypothetical protein Emag_000500 [Eimeria magna]
MEEYDLGRWNAMLSSLMALLPSCKIDCFTYLSNELAAMNVTVRLELEHMGAPVQVKQQLFDANSASATRPVKKEIQKQVHHGSETKRQQSRQASGHTA